MKKTRTKMAAAAVAAMLVAAVGCGCGSTGSAGASADVPQGAPPLMPAGHDGRFQDLGANGCYGCHGANEAANPMLASAPALPDDHYQQGMPATRAVDPVREQCITCHPLG